MNIFATHRNIRHYCMPIGSKLGLGNDWEVASENKKAKKNQSAERERERMGNWRIEN